MSEGRRGSVGIKKLSSHENADCFDAQKHQNDVPTKKSKRILRIKKRKRWNFNVYKKHKMLARFLNIE